MSLVKNLLSQKKWTVNELEYLLTMKDSGDILNLYQKAYEVKKRYIGQRVSLRALIEFSNSCQKNCYYCGIRQENHLSRYTMKREEIVDCLLESYQQGYGSAVLQSGERQDSFFINLVGDVLCDLREATEGKMGVTLSTGEQSEEVYQMWREKGAHRYLLRMETSNRELFKKIHPENDSFTERLKSLTTLKKLNYQTGTGVMIGLPWQSAFDLANDLLFFQEQDIDMVGMGPYLAHHETPLAELGRGFIPDKQDSYYLTLKMMALLRIIMPTINIASPTALESINTEGRIEAISVGANVIMLNITPTQYRQSYQLYPKKSLTSLAPLSLRKAIQKKLDPLGEKLILGERGDALHYTEGINKKEGLR